MEDTVDLLDVGVLDIYKINIFTTIKWLTTVFNSVSKEYIRNYWGTMGTFRRMIILRESRWKKVMTIRSLRDILSDPRLLLLDSSQFLTCLNGMLEWIGCRRTWAKIWFQKLFQLLQRSIWRSQVRRNNSMVSGQLSSN